MKHKKLFWVLVAVCAANLLAHLALYPSLPDIVPIHWNYRGVADGYGGRHYVLLMAAVPVLVLWVMQVARQIDPLSKNFERFDEVWNISVIAVTVFCLALSWLPELCIYGVLPSGGNAVGVFVCGGVGLLFLVLGNYMPRIKQNFTFGCRTPWALADEHNWLRTQRMGGIVFMVLGAALMALGVFSALLGEIGTLALLLAGVIGGTAWIYVYSYLVHLGKMK